MRPSNGFQKLSNLHVEFLENEEHSQTHLRISFITDDKVTSQCILDSFLSRKPRAPTQSSMPATHN